jgi:predicted nucleic acid-binding protein
MIFLNREREREKVETLLSAMTLLPVDDAAARRAGEIDRALASRGERLAPADTLIAGICSSRSVVLLTRNRKHFERVPGLTLGQLDDDDAHQQGELRPVLAQAESNRWRAHGQASFGARL